MSDDSTASVPATKDATSRRADAHSCGTGRGKEWFMNHAKFSRYELLPRVVDIGGVQTLSSGIGQHVPTLIMRYELLVALQLAEQNLIIRLRDGWTDAGGDDYRLHVDKQEPDFLRLCQLAELPPDTMAVVFKEWIADDEFFQKGLGPLSGRR